MITRKRSLEVVRLHNKTEEIGTTFGVNPSWLEHIKLWLPNGTHNYYGTNVRFDFALSDRVRTFLDWMKNLSYITSIPGVFLSLIGLMYLVQSKQHKILAFLMLPICSYYGLILFSLQLIRVRYILPLSVIMVILAGMGVNHLLKVVNDNQKPKIPLLKTIMGCVFCIILLVQFFSGYFPVTYVQIFDSKHQLAESIAEYIPKGNCILWQGGLTNLPNSDFYENYPLGFSSEADEMDRRSIEHIFTTCEDTTYILSETPLLQESLRLIRSWTYPDWITRWIYVPVVKEFYLYEIDG